MRQHLEQPAMMRDRKRPRGESTVPLRNMSEANRVEWLRREAELVAESRVHFGLDPAPELEAEPDPPPAPPAPKPPSRASRVLALLRDSGGCWTSAELADMIGDTQAKILSALSVLVARGVVRKRGSRWQGRMRRTWEAVP